MPGCQPCASPGGIAWHLIVSILSSVFLYLPVAAQFDVNGQIYTNALAIVDAPAPNSVQHAGSVMPIAIDVSANGKLPTSAQLPGSGLPTSFDWLELYLFSTQTALNITLSNGTSLLTQESGSTVKHINFQVSNCVPAGNYNFTVYEGSHVNGTAFFSITSIPISIQNSSPNGSCVDHNVLQSLPQASSPPPTNPLIDTSSLTPLLVNFDSKSLRAQSVITSPVEGPTVTLTLGPSGVIYSGYPGVPSGTLPPGVSVATVTVALVAIETVEIVSTLPGRTVGFTTVVTTTATETTTVLPMLTDTSEGFVPVNSASTSSPLLILWCMVVLSLVGPYALLIHL